MMVSPTSIRDQKFAGSTRTLELAWARNQCCLAAVRSADKHRKAWPAPPLFYRSDRVRSELEATARVRENDGAGVRERRFKKWRCGRRGARMRTRFDARIKRLFKPREPMSRIAF
jgi:hypothetical protein